ncbi:MAG: family hydrolase [Ferruginibacter sp.]|nr:family hydrolase [Ferruginibacter sp.]
MDLSKIKLVAADMDGTLLNARHELSRDFYRVFDKIKAKGLLFAAASGRQFFNLLNKFDTIQEDVIFIAENGSYVVYKGEDILVQAMEPAIVKEQLLVAKHIPDVYTILCGKKRAYIENETPRFIENVQMYYDRYEVVDDLSKVEDDQFLKIALCDLAGSEANSYNFFRQKQDELQVKISGSIWLDLSHLLANKGTAIEVLQKKFGISFEETMVFGDYLNDLEMIQKAGFSYAMENAHPDIKKAARFLTRSNEEDGVTVVLLEMLSSMNGQS